MDSSDLSDGPITLQEYLEVKKALASSEAKVQQLMKVNNNLSEEVRRLQKEVRWCGAQISWTNNGKVWLCILSEVITLDFPPVVN